MKKFTGFLILLISWLTFNCTADNKVEMAVPELLSLLSPEDAIIYLGDREIDPSLTPNCGTASPATNVMPGGMTQPGQQAPQNTGSSRSQFTIFSFLVMKRTKETLALRFTYDLNQFQGPIDAQQGFVLSGDLYKRTITGNQGIVKWYNQGLGYINTGGGGGQQGGGGAQALSFMNIELNLTGSFTETPTDAGQIPTQCPTLDNQTCNYGAPTNGRTCFTIDNLACIRNTGGGQTVTIIGKITCNATNVIPN